MFMVILCVQFYRSMQLIFSTLLKGIIRKECQSFTNHGHDKTPPTVFNPLSLWLTLPRNMGVSHTLRPPSITRAILACLWLAQGLHKAQKNQSSRAVLWCSRWFHVFNFIDWRNFFFQHYLRALSAKNANHLQTTDTLKRHRRYSIHYHCGWPSLGIRGSATHYGLPALPEPFLRACGLHKAQKNQNSRAVLWCSGWFHVFNFIDWRNLFFNAYLTNNPHGRLSLTQVSHLRNTTLFHCLQWKQVPPPRGGI